MQKKMQCTSIMHCALHDATYSVPELEVKRPLPSLWPAQMHKTQYSIAIRRWQIGPLPWRTLGAVATGLWHCPATWPAQPSIFNASAGTWRLLQAPRVAFQFP
jgi:hypothetical protein